MATSQPYFPPIRRVAASDRYIPVARSLVTRHVDVVVDVVGVLLLLLLKSAHHIRRMSILPGYNLAFIELCQLIRRLSSFSRRAGITSRSRIPPTRQHEDSNLIIGAPSKEYFSPTGYRPVTLTFIRRRGVTDRARYNF